MNIRCLCFMFVAAAVNTACAADYKPGDIVVAIADSDIQDGSRVVDKLEIGFALPVMKVTKERAEQWLWVSNGKPGWVASEDVVPLDSAIEHFTKAIAAVNAIPDATKAKFKAEFEAATVARLYAGRAMVHVALEEPDKAIADYNQALTIEPREASYLGNRGIAYAHKEDFAHALADLSQAIELRRSWQLYSVRGAIYAVKGDYADAMSDIETALRLDPGAVPPVIALAEFLACCPKASFRNGPAALYYAQKACEESQQLNAESLHVLACAEAETGNFGEAMKRESEAIQASPKNRVKTKAIYNRALKLFEEQKPFHEIVLFN